MQSSIGKGTKLLETVTK